jgi:hypothetical protein
MKRICIALMGAVCLGLLAPPALERAAGLSSHFTASANSAATFPPGTIFAVDTGNLLRHFNAAAPGTILGTVAITGLQPGEVVLGIDFRPATGQLYGLGSTSRVYVINPVTGAASPVDGAFTPGLTGTDFGFDFNPTVDRIRVVSDNEQNLRLNPDTGGIAATDLAINPAGNLGSTRARTRSSSRTRRTTARSPRSGRSGSTRAGSWASTSPRAPGSRTRR